MVSNSSSKVLAETNCRSHRACQATYFAAGTRAAASSESYLLSWVRVQLLSSADMLEPVDDSGARRGPANGRGEDPDD